MKNKKSELTIEMVAIYILAIAFLAVVIYLIMKNNNIMEKLFGIFAGLK
jgi:uncharacterized protein YoxC